MLPSSYSRGLLATAAALLLGSSIATAQQAPQLVAETIALPNGFQPEGIAKGPGSRAFVGTLNGGGVFDVDLLTGAVDFLVQPRPDRVAAGLVYDPQRDIVIVSGANTGTGTIYDAESGQEFATIQLTSQMGFINDVRVSSDAAFFTDSMRPVIYRVPLGATGRRPGPVQEIRLGGDFEFIEGQFNSNGIESVLDGRFLLIVNSTTGDLFRVDPSTGNALRIDLSDGNVMNGDGILLEGNRLLVVQNMQNQVAVVLLNNTFTTGRVLQNLADPDFQVPTTIASFDGFLFAVNARFDEVAPGMAQPNDMFNIVRVTRP